MSLLLFCFVLSVAKAHNNGRGMSRLAQPVLEFSTCEDEKQRDVDFWVRVQCRPLRMPAWIASVGECEMRPLKEVSCRGTQITCAERDVL